MKPKLYFKKPKKILYKTYSFGCLPDDVLIDAYLLATRGTRHLIYCTKECYHDGRIDKGSGSFVICKKPKKHYLVASKNDNIFRCWRNMGDGDEKVESFIIAFITGRKEYENTDILVTTKQVEDICAKLDKNGSKNAKKKLKEWKALNHEEDYQ